MPLAAVFYFSSVKGTGVDPIMFTNGQRSAIPRGSSNIKAYQDGKPVNVVNK